MVGSSTRSPFASLLLYCILIILAILTVAPFLWMIVTSFKHAADVFTPTPTFLPMDQKTGALYLTSENYNVVLGVSGFANAFWNSVIVAAAVVPLKIALCAMAAYAFARIRFPGREVMFALLLASIMIPGLALLVPRLIVTRYLGMYDSLWALIIPMAASAFDVFLMRQFFLSLPVELEEAAFIDGANRWQIFWKIVIPLSKPVLSVVAINIFIWHWNDLIWPLISITSPSKFTLPLALTILATPPVSRPQLVSAGAAIAVIPVIIVFLIFQRRIVQGIALTGTKG